MPAPGWRCAVDPAMPGERILVAGRVVDGEGTPVPDALIETWQVTEAGGTHIRGSAPGVSPVAGFARVPTDIRGAYSLETLRPRRPADHGSLAPHLVVMVFARGLLRRLITRIYFADDTLDGDPVLALVPADRRSTLIAQPTGPGQYRFDIVLQGPGETVFFDG